MVPANSDQKLSSQEVQYQSLEACFVEVLDSLLHRGNLSFLIRLRATITQAFDTAISRGTKALCRGEPESETTVTPESLDEPVSEFAQYSESRRASERISRTTQALAAIPDVDNATVSVSDTGHGVHIRWKYADDDEAVRSTSAPELGFAAAEPLQAASTTPPGSPSSRKRAREADDDVLSELRLPSQHPTQIQDSQTQDNSVPQSAGSPLVASSPSSPHLQSSAPTSVQSSYPPSPLHLSPPPPPPSPSGPTRPFNHVLQVPRSRAVRRENAFYHRSHYEIAWVPEFGPLDEPPMTLDEAMPPWMTHTPPPAAAAAAAPPPPPPPAPAPVPALLPQADISEADDLMPGPEDTPVASASESDGHTQVAVDPINVPLPSSPVSFHPSLDG